MRTTKSDSSPRVPSSRRLTVALSVLATGVAVLSGCSTSSSPGPTTTPPTTTVVTPTSASSTAAPAPTGTGGPEPSIVMPTPQLPTPPVVPPPFSTVPTSPSTPSTPNPSTPQTNPPAGTTFTGEGLTDAQAQTEQQAVDGGHQPWRLDTVMVAKAFVQGRFGWTNVQTSTGAPMVVFVTNQDGSKVTLHLIQPATKGDKGIWEVDSGVWD
ncbi:hypothetical protein ACFXHA_38755 [Nocardia sp. NPDC059240]|uniref:hypothetical protein n=1 Tax=Nocardia sp. NPDC059240 TaxID=3346786 RepID=UPI0036BE7C09